MSEFRQRFLMLCAGLCALAALTILIEFGYKVWFMHELSVKSDQLQRDFGNTKIPGVKLPEDPWTTPVTPSFRNKSPSERGTDKGGKFD